ncbi:MAG TPA: hypothetical protein VHS33_09705 [Sphingomicrobium sp.]|nr:hypothetical protein [Sphingomicrobium sp.]
MSKQSNPGKKAVELRAAVRPSRIRRDPPAPAPQRKAVVPYPTEREIWIVAIGVVLFALAIAAITFGFSQITGN